MGRHRKGRAPMASLLFGLMVLAQVAWVPGGPCVRGPSGHGGHGTGAVAPATSPGPQAESSGHHGGHMAAASHTTPEADASPGEPGGSHEGCDCALTCPACAAGGAPGLPGAPVAGILLAPSATVSLQPAPAGLMAVLRTPHALPFSNGPPLRS